MRIRFTEASKIDLGDIYRYIAEDSIAAADKHRQALQKRWLALIDQPLMGRKRDDIRLGYRSITEGNYIILYRLVAEHELEIVRVVHAKRDLSKLSLPE